EVKHLDVELEQELLVQAHVLAQARILMTNAEAARVGNARRRVTEGIILRRSERVGIEQAVAGRVEIRVADVIARRYADDAVRPLAAIEDRQTISLRDLQRSATLIVDDARDEPAAEEFLRYAAPVQQPLTLAHRDLVDRAEPEVLRRVESGDGPFRTAIPPIL